MNERAIEGHKGFNMTQWKEYLAYAVMNTYNATPSWGMTFNNIGEVYDYLIAGGEGADLQNIFTTSNDTNWRKEIQKTGYQQNVDFNVSGGNDKLTYYTSANYFNQESIVKGSYFQQNGFHK